MKYFILLLFVIVGTKGLSQESLPEETAKVIVDQYLKGYKTGDTLVMQKMMHPRITLQTMYLNTNQENVLLFINPLDLFKYVAATAPQQKWDVQVEKYVVHSDGNLGNVWVPFMFYKDGEFNYCGAYSFTLTYTDDSWKILHLVESRRVGGCFDHHD